MPRWWSTAALLTTLALMACADDKVPKRSNKRSYVCPPDFVRLSNKCYYFSTGSATWQDAYWKCSDMHSNLATIRSPYQDKILRRLLDKSTVASLERWIGGRYNWEQMNWQWAASGKVIDYKGFLGPQPTDKETMRWHCIILNPRLHYRWDHRSCLEKKHYICQTKIKNVSKKGKKKLERQYNATKYKKLNEVAVPDIPEIDDNKLRIASNETRRLSPHNLDNNELSVTAYAHSPKALRKRKGRRGKGRKKNRKSKEGKVSSGILQDAPHIKEGGVGGDRLRDTPTKKAANNVPVGRLNWRTYYKGTPSPLHPRVIVEDFSYTN